MIELYVMMNNDEYDYEDESTVTEDKTQAFKWLEDGLCEEVAVLDACDYSYLTYLDKDDIPPKYSTEELLILEWVKMLAHSQGFYGRLLMELKEDRMMLEHLASQGFTSCLDMIYYLEC